MSDELIEVRTERAPAVLPLHDSVVAPSARETQRRSRIAFFTVLAILLLVGVTLQAAVWNMGLYFRKLPVDLRKPLTELPAKLGNWVQVSKDQPIEHNIEEVLATKLYIFRDYVRVGTGPDDVSPATVARFDGLSTLEQQKLLGEVRRDKPRAVLNVAVTYYTGLVDTVAHVPDRCYVADGFEPTNPEQMRWNCLPPDKAAGGETSVDLSATGVKKPLEVRYITFEDQNSARQAETRNVGYFFNANGRYAANPLDVRVILQNLRERYGYYAKVELMNLTKDRAGSTAAMQDFLSSAMPAIQECLPDWDAVVRSK